MNTSYTDSGWKWVRVAGDIGGIWAGLSMGWTWIMVLCAIGLIVELFTD